ncbi:hypothetical protein ETB97_008082 [Aspergillus alliaceus]|nr:hypothetical protein ETB97_008082 [Aspergillus burnettii]
MRGKYPFRISSTEKGALARPGIYTIVEDVVAVDGGEELKFRQILDARYCSNRPIQILLQRLGWAWGFSGLAVAIALLVLIGMVPNMEASFVIGWIIPWAWAAVLSLLTRSMTKAALACEESAPIT